MMTLVTWTGSSWIRGLFVVSLWTYLYIYLVFVQYYLSFVRILVFIPFVALCIQAILLFFDVFSTEGVAIAWKNPSESIRFMSL